MERADDMNMQASNLTCITIKLAFPCAHGFPDLGTFQVSFSAYWGRMSPIEPFGAYPLSLRSLQPVIEAAPRRVEFLQILDGTCACVWATGVVKLGGSWFLNSVFVTGMPVSSHFRSLDILCKLPSDILERCHEDGSLN
eukprot:384100-Pelagomonas_calceolata.AAC.4